ncbi:hypothetical protein [Crocosphaera sp. Alani8]|uniref:hypothetical protein n=1 Tax=Crocosphaera sp. Alani8 TaxID=3038952 RepID=UPI00313C502C
MMNKISGGSLVVLVSSKKEMTMIIDNLEYEEQFKPRIVIFGGFNSSIPLQIFPQEKFLDGKQVAYSEVSYGSTASGIRSAMTMLLDFSQSTEQVAEGFVSSSSSSIVSLSE